MIEPIGNGSRIATNNAESRMVSRRFSRDFSREFACHQGI